MGVGNVDVECQPGQATIHVIKHVFSTARSNIICQSRGMGTQSGPSRAHLQRVAGEEASTMSSENTHSQFPKQPAR